MALIDNTDLTWNGKEVQEMGQALMTAMYQNPALSDFHEIRENIKAQEQIAFLGLLSKLTKAHTDCGGSPTSTNIPMTEKFWTPAAVRFWLSMCATELEQTFFVWGQNAGIDRLELVNDKSHINAFVVQRILEAVSEDTLRIAWFNDTDADNVENTPGLITTGVSLTDYNIIDGLWKQIYADVASNPSRQTTIALNSQTTYANQAFDDTDVTNKLAHDILQDMLEAADTRLIDQTSSGLQFIVTRSIYNQLKREYKNYTALQSSFEMVQNGKKALMFDGIPVIPFNFWDRTIDNDFDNGTAHYQPHRALLTVRGNIPLGFDASNATNVLKYFFLDKEETNNWKGGFKIDAKLLESHMYQAAY